MLRIYAVHFVLLELDVARGWMFTLLYKFIPKPHYVQYTDHGGGPASYSQTSYSRRPLLNTPEAQTLE